MRWFFDTEFHEDGRSIELISIGLVSEAGEEYYAISTEFNYRRVKDNEWLAANVLPHLPRPQSNLDTMEVLAPWKARSKIATEIRELVLRDGKPEFWAYFADYDWVALCQLYGRMIDLPPGFPMYCMDLKQLMKMLGFDKSDLPTQDPAGAHDALEDAKWARTAWLWIDQRLRVARETVT